MEKNSDLLLSKTQNTESVDPSPVPARDPPDSSPLSVDPSSTLSVLPSAAPILLDPPFVLPFDTSDDRAALLDSTSSDPLSTLSVLPSAAAILLDPPSVLPFDSPDDPAALLDSSSSNPSSTLSVLPSAAAISVVPSRVFTKVDPLSLKIVRLDPSEFTDPCKKLATPPVKFILHDSPTPDDPSRKVVKIDPSEFIDLSDLKPQPPLDPPLKFVYDDAGPILDPWGNVVDTSDPSVPFEMRSSNPPVKFYRHYLPSRDPSLKLTEKRDPCGLLKLKEKLKLKPKLKEKLKEVVLGSELDLDLPAPILPDLPVPMLPEKIDDLPPPMLLPEKIDDSPAPMLLEKIDDLHPAMLLNEPVPAHVCYHPLCGGSTFPSLSGILYHNHQRHPDFFHNCDECGNVFQTADDLSLHQAEVHHLFT